MLALSRKWLHRGARPLAVGVGAGGLAGVVCGTYLGGADVGRATLGSAALPTVCALFALALVIVRGTLARRSEARFRRITDMAADIVYRVRVSPRLELEYVNPAFERVLGYTPRELQGDLACFLDGAITPDSIRPWLEELASEGLQSFTWRCRRADGRQIWLETRFSVVREAFGGLVLEGLARDVTSERETQESLLHQARHDLLTGVSNRASFDRALSAMVARCAPDGAPFTLLFVDLDGFKAVNDTMGHDAGDAVLRAVSARLRRAVREHDQVFRLGGDEFAILLTQMQGDPLPLEVAERIVERVSLPVSTDDGLAHVGASVGVASFPADGRTPEELLRRADMAMYKAKRRGGNRTVRYADWRQAVPQSGIMGLLGERGALVEDHTGYELQAQQVRRSGSS